MAVLWKCLVSHAVPYRRTIRMKMMMVSARCAFLARGSRKAITPLETASTPVMAAQPPENAFINIHRPRKRTVCGTAGCKRLIHAHRNQRQQGADEEKCRHDEGGAGILYPAQVHDCQDGKNQQAESQGVALE